MEERKFKPCSTKQFLNMFKVVEHNFGSLWDFVICQNMARERLQLTSWNFASGKYTDTQRRASLRSNKDQLCVYVIREVSVIQKCPLR